MTGVMYDSGVLNSVIQILELLENIILKYATVTRKQFNAQNKMLVYESAAMGMCVRSEMLKEFV
jgi:hypothetical protein